MSLRNYLDKIRPNFEEGGKLHAFKSVFDGFDTFLYVPNETSKSGVSIHDAIDSKRIMSIVVISLLPALLFGMYNIGYQNAVAAGKLADATCWGMFLYGLLALLPKILVSYIVGLGIEFAWAQGRRDTGRLPCVRYSHPIDNPCYHTIVDPCPCHCLCCYLHKGNLWRNGYEHFQCCFSSPCLPLLLLSK